MTMQDSQQKLFAFLRSNFTSLESLSSIPQHLTTVKKDYDGLVAKKQKIEQETPAFIEELKKEVTKTQQDVEKLSSDRKKLLEHLNTNNGELVGEFDRLHENIVKFQSKRNYLVLIMEICLTIQKTILEVEDLYTQASELKDDSAALDPFLQMTQIQTRLISLDCPNLKRALHAYVIKLADTISAKAKKYVLHVHLLICRAYSDALVGLQWPTPMSKIKITESAMNQFKETFIHLALIQTS